MDDLDLIAVGLGQAHALAAAWFVDRLDRGRPRRLGKALEIVLARRVIGKAHEFRLTLLRDMKVMAWIGAAHIERARRAIGPCHAEPREKLLHDVEIGGAQPPEGHVGYFDEGHDYCSRFMSCIVSFAQNSTRRHSTPTSIP